MCQTCSSKARAHEQPASPKSLPGQSSDKETEARQCKAARRSCKDQNGTMPSPHSVTSLAPSQPGCLAEKHTGDSKENVEQGAVSSHSPGHRSPHADLQQLCAASLKLS